MDDWVVESKCRNDSAYQAWLKDPKNKGRDFFHDKQTRDLAIAYCADCPVRLLCLAEANNSLKVGETGWLLDFPEHMGVMGGTSLRQRRAFKKKMIKKAAEMQEKINAMQQKYQLPPGIAS